MIKDLIHWCAEPTEEPIHIATVCYFQIDGRVPDGANFLTKSEDNLQLGTLSYSRGDAVSPHYHLPQKRELQSTQEVIIVMKGLIIVTFYGNDGSVVADRTLREGDSVFFLQGGHSIRCVDDAWCYEVKQGPYRGKEQDKHEFKPK